jgi:ubiquinone/menaquinone biosynthesis C-methylase UbiE
LPTIPKPDQPQKGHRLFARGYDKVMCDFERNFGPRYRGEFLQNLSGAVLEIGVGTGANFPHYQRNKLTNLVGIEPDYYMLEQAKTKKAALGLEIELLEAAAECLPFANNEFDAVVSMLVLCSVTDLNKAISEVGRVLKPGGKFYFLEHVLSRNIVGRVYQTGLNPLWGLMTGGCHLNRNTGKALQLAGFKFEQLEWVSLLPTLSPINPQIWGVATRN